jgi:hypothetical protein
MTNGGMFIKFLKVKHHIVLCIQYSMVFFWFDKNYNNIKKKCGHPLTEQDNIIRVFLVESSTMENTSKDINRLIINIISLYDNT